GEAVDPVADVALVVGELQRERRPLVTGRLEGRLHRRLRVARFHRNRLLELRTRNVLIGRRQGLRGGPTTRPPGIVTSAQKLEHTADRPWRALPGSVGVALRGFVPDTADEIIDAIRDEVPAYSRPLEGAFGEGIRTGVEQALTDFL